MKLVLLFSAALIMYYINNDSYLDSEQLTAPQRILSSGHPLEIHEVTTPDGYVLQLHRIPGGGVRGPVLLMHGLFSSSGFYVVNRRDRNLPYILAEKGYDVWLGNYRGSPYSLRHVRYSTHETRFWNYSITELGICDLSTIIDYILKTTDKSALSYVGHSLNTCTMFILLTEKPEYNTKVRVANLMAPFFLVNFRTSLPLTSLVVCTTYFRYLLRFIGVDEFGFGLSADVMTKLQWTSPFIFTNLMLLLTGHIWSPVSDKSVLQRGSAVTGGYTSSKVLAHIYQYLMTNEHRHFDYGKAGNLLAYGSETAPFFNVSEIKAPIALFCSSHDDVIPVEACLVLADTLPNIVHMDIIKEPFFGHMDFGWSTIVKEYLYDKIVQLIEVH